MSRRRPAGVGPTGPTATGPATYEIRVAGHLDDHWAATLDHLTLVRLEDGTTSLTGPLVAQAQLHGLLARIRDLGVPLLALRTLDHTATYAQSPALCEDHCAASGSHNARHPGDRGAGNPDGKPHDQLHIKHER
jgi:hypothetical protein